MNHKNSIIKLVGAAFLMGTVITSCFTTEEIPLVKLAALEKEITVEAAGGVFDMDFYVNSAYHIEYLDDVDWLRLSATDPVDEMAVLTLDCDPNPGFKRRVDFVLCSDLDTRRDTVLVKQKAVADAFLEFDEASVVLPGAGGTTTASVHTNVSFGEMTVEILYSDADNVDWITDFEIVDIDSDDREMRVTVDRNTDEVAPRTASVSLSFTDGWGDNVAVNFVLLQCNANEEAAREITFEEFRSQYATGGVIYDYVQISGIVVSNKDNGNAGEPEQTTTSTIDYTPTSTTIYLESEDGRYGINVQTATEDENVFNQFDHVTLLLHGATGGMLEEDPACYQITGIDKTMVFARVSGTLDDVPVKERTIGTLTDDDLYTYVKLTNVELPIRKGSLFPVEGGYANEANVQRIAKYPLLVRDINGDDMYMYTNDKCLYRRDGTRLPYGSGNLYGVVVHEHFSRFEWRNGADPADIYDDETLANIGRYQLRHQTKDDVWREMEDDFENGFSALLCEYRYGVIRNGINVPSYGDNGWIDHTYQTKYTGSASKDYTSSEGTHFSLSTSYDYLGPSGCNVASMYGQNFGNRNGLGIIVDPDKENTDYLPDRFAYNNEGKLEFACQYAENQYCGYGSTGWVSPGTSNTNAPNYVSEANRGKGHTNGSAHLEYRNSYWWDDDTGRPYSYLIHFSTAEIYSPVVSMQIYIRANQEYGNYTPRYWCAEWALTDSQEERDDSKWSLIGEFTVPDWAAWTSTSFWSLPAYKPINFTLPSDILGEDDVYIRIHPTSDICGSGGDYADARLKDSASGTALADEHAISLGYFAIRYNK